MKNSIRHNSEFQRIINKKRFISNNFFKIYYQKNDALQLGIAVGKKRVKKAVDRNKIKRWIRNIVNQNYKNMPYKIIIVVILNVDNIKFKVFKEELVSLLNKLKG